MNPSILTSRNLVLILLGLSLVGTFFLFDAWRAPSSSSQKLEQAIGELAALVPVILQQQQQQQQPQESCHCNTALPQGNQQQRPQRLRKKTIQQSSPSSSIIVPNNQADDPRCFDQVLDSIDWFQEVVFMRNHPNVEKFLSSQAVTRKATFVARLQDQTKFPYWVAFGEAGMDGHDFGILLKKLYDDYGAMTVIDVGGNCGRFSFQAASLGFSVFTFEPLRMNFLRLSLSRCMNHWQNRVTLINKGASDVATVVNIIENDSNGQILPETALQNFKKEELQQIETVRIDDVIDPDTLRVIPIFKVDCEGFEGKALRGAARLLSSGKVRVIALELSPQNLLTLSEMSSAALFHLLDGYGFDIYLIDVSHQELITAFAPYDLRPSLNGGYSAFGQRLINGDDLSEVKIQPSKFDVLGGIFNNHPASQANLVAFSRKH